MSRNSLSAALAVSISIGAGTLLGAGSAQAEGLWATKSPAPGPGASASDWTGSYIAFGLSRSMTSYSSNTAFAPTSASGLGGSVILGYSLQQDNLVYGAELLANIDNIRGASAGCGLGATFTCRSRVRNYLAARVRVGYAMGDTLVFGTLGLASDMQDQVIRDGGVRVAQGKARHNGPVIGVGVEHALDESWGLRGDLEHYRLNARSYDLAVPGPTNIRPRHNAARFSIVNRF